MIEAVVAEVVAAEAVAAAVEAAVGLQGALGTYGTACGSGGPCPPAITLAHLGAPADRLPPRAREGANFMSTVATLVPSIAG